MRYIKGAMNHLTLVYHDQGLPMYNMYTSVKAHLLTLLNPLKTATDIVCKIAFKNPYNLYGVWLCYPITPHLFP